MDCLLRECVGTLLCEMTSVGLSREPEPQCAEEERKKTLVKLRKKRLMPVPCPPACRSTEGGEKGMERGLVWQEGEGRRRLSGALRIRLLRESVEERVWIWTEVLALLVREQLEVLTTEE